MKSTAFIKNIDDSFKGIEECGFVANDEMVASIHRSDLEPEEFESIVMRLYYMAADPEKGIRYFINQYADGKYLYITKLNEDLWFYVLSFDEAFAKLHFYIQFLLSDESIELDDSKGTEAGEDHDSILAAQRIQHMLFEDLTPLLKDFKDTYFWYSPKDTIGGDFYWGKETAKHKWFVIGDCTGHGVEGALATVSVLSILNQVFDDKLKPHWLIKNIHYSLNDIQKQKLEDGYGIGNEMMVIRYNKADGSIDYAGTGLPLYVIGKNFKYYKTKSAHYEPERVVKFIRSRHLKLESGQGIFTHSDGIIDQFDESSAKYKRKRLLQTLKTGEINAETIEANVRAWQGKMDQTDDIVALYFSH